MKGLLLKDIYLLKELKKFIIMVVGISVIMVAGSTQAAFALGYINILTIGIVMNSVSYDDYNKGMTFLMTLPVTAKEYVREKFCLGFLAGTCGWLFSVILTGGKMYLSGKSIPWGEWGPIWLIFLGISFLAFSIMLPFSLKYGSEKGRMALISAVILIYIGAYLVVKVVRKSVNLDVIIERIGASKLWIPCYFLLVVLAVGISYLCCVRIMRKKEY